MQIIKNGEILDLKENQIEIDNTSPIFNMKGTQSVSINFPKTPKNLRLFGFPNRLDRYNKVSGDEQVEVRDGVLNKIRYNECDCRRGKHRKRISDSERVKRIRK